MSFHRFDACVPFRFDGRPTALDTGVRKFSGTAYTGGVITDHPAFDRVAFDLSTTKVQVPAPLLLNHLDPVGVIRNATAARDLRVDGDLFADARGAGGDERASNVAAMADRGMPWQMSVGIWPGEIDQVKAGAKVSLNGQEFAGPLTVFRQNRVREVSLVALGADDRTSAVVFGRAANAKRPATVEEICEAARRYIAAQAVCGHQASIADAVAFVTRG